MKFVEVKKMGEIEYFTKSDLQNEKDEIIKKIRNEIISITENLANELNVTFPDFAFSLSITNIDDSGNADDTAAITYHKKDLVSHDNNIIHLSLKNIENKNYIKAVLAHEMRHIFQQKFKKIEKYANGFLESLYDENEIDSDGFAIFYLSKKSTLSIEESGIVACENEYLHFKNAFEKRIKRAYQIKKEMEKS